MKTKEEILKDKYTINNNGEIIAFNKKTPIKTAKEIIRLYNSETRVIIDYGDIYTGISWNEMHDITGRIGMSRGCYNILYPILVYNSRSFGGCSILTHHILSIKVSRGKNTIYEYQHN